MEPYISSSVDTGYFREVVDAIFVQMGVEITYEFVPHLRAPKLVDNGTFQVLAPAFMNENKNDKFIYTEPVLSSDLGYVSLERETEDKNDLRSTLNLVADNLKLQLSSKIVVQQLDMLNAKRIDKLYMEKYLAAEVIANKRPAFIQKFHFQKGPYHQLDLRVAVSKTTPKRRV